MQKSIFRWSTVCLQTLTYGFALIGLTGCYIQHLPSHPPSAMNRLRLSLAYLHLGEDRLSQKNLQIACAQPGIATEIKVIAGYLWQKLGDADQAQQLYRAIYSELTGAQGLALELRLQAEGLPTFFSGYLEYLVSQKRYRSAINWLQSTRYQAMVRKRTAADPCFRIRYEAALSYLKENLIWAAHGLPDSGFYFSPRRLFLKRRFDTLCLFQNNLPACAIKG